MFAADPRGMGEGRQAVSELALLALRSVAENHRCTQRMSGDNQIVFLCTVLARLLNDFIDRFANACLSCDSV